MKRVLVGILILYTALSAQSQNTSLINELEEGLIKTTDPEQRIRLHSQLLDLYEVYNINKALEHAHSAWAIASEVQIKPQMATLAHRLGQIYQKYIVDANMAVKWQLDGLRTAEEIKDSSLIAEYSYDLAYSIAEQGDKVRANQHLDRAIKIAGKSGDYQMLIRANTRAGDFAFSNKEKYNYYRRGLIIAEQHPSDTLSLVYAWSKMGDHCFSSKQQDQARYWYAKVFELLDPSSYTQTSPELIKLYAMAALRTGHFDRCIAVTPNIINAQNHINGNNWYSPQGMRILAEAYHYTGQDSLAFWTVLNYMSLEDSLHDIRSNDQARRIILSLQSQFDTQKKEKELELLQSQTRFERFVVFALAVLLILLSIFTFYMNRERNRNHQQNKQLAQLNQTKDKLLSIISHDVRSPIQALQNIIQLFELDIATKQDVHTVTTQVKDSVQNLTEGLDNLFFWAQNQQQELRAYPEIINLSDILKAQVQQHSLKAAKKQIIITDDLPATHTVFADPLHARLIINNVLVNAIKFTPVNGKIRITCTINQEQGYSILSIQDSGKGILPEDIEKIFNPLVRYTRPGTVGEPGSGLGLSLSRDLLWLNKGDMNIASQPGNGATIHIIFPNEKN